MADGPTSDEGLDPELLAVVQQAAREVGPARPTEKSPVVIQYNAPATRASLSVAWLSALLLVVAAGALYLSVRSQGDPPAAEVEADLRWAVGHVVRRVEALQQRTGQLPSPEDLTGLVSEVVVYERLGDGYRVVGRRGPVLVQYDDRVPLADWLRERTYPEGGGR